MGRNERVIGVHRSILCAESFCSFRGVEPTARIVVRDQLDMQLTMLLEIARLTSKPPLGREPFKLLALWT